MHESFSGFVTDPPDLPIFPTSRASGSPRACGWGLRTRRACHGARRGRRLPPRACRQRHRAPPAELDIGGEYDAPPLAALGDHLAEQPCAVHIEGDVAEPVQDEEPCPGDIREQPAGRPLALGLPQLEHQLRGLEEPHGIACRGRRDAERRGHSGLAVMQSFT